MFSGTYAGGIGITLTAASTVILLDRPMTPGDAEQAEDRLHRISQRNAVTAVWLRAFKVCRILDELLMKKIKAIGEVLDAGGAVTAGQIVKEVFREEAPD